MWPSQALEPSQHDSNWPLKAYHEKQPSKIVCFTLLSLAPKTHEGRLHAETPTGSGHSLSQLHTWRDMFFPHHRRNERTLEKTNLATSQWCICTLSHHTNACQNNQNNGNFYCGRSEVAPIGVKIEREEKNREKTNVLRDQTRVATLCLDVPSAVHAFANFARDAER